MISKFFAKFYDEMKVTEKLPSVSLSKIETYLYALVACTAFAMSGLFKVYDWLTEVFDKHGDPRTKGWLLMSNPLPTVMICLCYVATVKYLGPKFMANRKPFELRNTLILYNLFQVVFSAWLCYECLMSGWWGHYSFKCQPVDRSTSPFAMRLGMSGWFTGEYNLRCQPVDHSSSPHVMRMVRVCWWYYFSKFTEFMDTIFFVLRKKTRHISTLHVIHHGVMPFSVWFGVRFMPGGHSTFFGLLNTFVHIIMYAYYMLAALGPHMEKYLWWKKYLTGLQMVQFIMIMVHAFQLMFIECDYPRSFVVWIGAHAVMFFFLFKQFYNESYSKTANKIKVETDSSQNGKISQRNGDIKTTHGYSKQSDYYVNGDGLSRPDVVQRSSAVAGAAK